MISLLPMRKKPNWNQIRREKRDRQNYREVAPGIFIKTI